MLGSFYLHHHLISGCQAAPVHKKIFNYCIVSYIYIYCIPCLIRLLSRKATPLLSGKISEDRKNPAFIPRQGAFYEHDLRLGEDGLEEEDEK
jgi:hypothetical protein